MKFLFDDYVLDSDRRELTRDSNLIPTGPQVFDTLVYLIRNRERVVSKDELLDAIWQGRVISESTLTSHINAVRKSVEDSGEKQRLVRTVARKGFRFVGTVTMDSDVRDGLSTAPAPLVASIEMRDPAPLMSAPAVPDKPSIAVLPFQNISGDPDQEYFADGMAEEILTALSYCTSLFVIARNSSFAYKGRVNEARQVGRDLGVRYLLGGSVRRSGERLRFTAQLVDATSGATIWADRFDGGITDVFTLQDDIAAGVAAAIEPNIQIAEISRMKRKPATSLDAYDLLLRAQQLEYEFTRESFDAALRCLEQALAIDPNYAQAMALAAYCYAERSQQDWLTDRPRETAEGIRLAARAIDLEKNDANVLWMAAYAARQLLMDGQLAKELAYRSLQLNPNSAMALAMTGWVEAILNEPVTALEHLRRAARLSPRDPRTWFITTGIGTAHSIAGDHHEAIVWLKRALSQNPRSTPARRILAASLASVGQMDQARETLQELLKVEPHLTISTLRDRMRMLHESVWDNYSAGLRLAGLPE